MRRSVTRVNENTASEPNGFMTTTYASCPFWVVPSGRKKERPARGRHASAATPESSPPARATHPAAIHPPKYSTIEARSRPADGTAT